MKIREIIAFPFILAALSFEWISLLIGGDWSMYEFYKHHKRVVDKINKDLTQNKS